VRKRSVHREWCYQANKCFSEVGVSSSHTHLLVVSVSGEVGLRKEELLCYLREVTEHALSRNFYN